MEWIVEAETREDLVDGHWYGGEELVRCEDCGNWERLLFDAGSGCYCPFVDRYTTDDWYCADGERRDDDNNR